MDLGTLTEHQYTSTNHYTKTMFYVQFFLTTLLCTSLFILIAVRKKLLFKRSNQVFLNVLLVHIIFNIAAITTEVTAPNDYQTIAVNNAYLLGLITSVILLCIERLLLVKYPRKHSKIDDNLTSAAVTFSWAPCILFLTVELINEKHHIRHLLLFRVVLIVLGEVFLVTLICIIFFFARRYDNYVKKNTSLPEQTHRMLRECSVCVAIVMSFSLLWLLLLVAVFMFLAGKMDIGYIYMIQHFLPLNALKDVVIYICLSIEMRHEVKCLFKKCRRRLLSYLVGPAFCSSEPRVYTLESLRFTLVSAASVTSCESPVTDDGQVEQLVWEFRS